MAEFVEAMKAWRRMCDACSKDESCATCPMQDNDACVGIWEANIDNMQEYENKIMKWDREHPKTDIVREALKMCLRETHCHGMCPYSGKENCRGHLLADALKVIGDG